MATQATTTAPLRPHQARLSSVMRMAWIFHRDAVSPRPFRASLRAAWAWVKRLEASRVRNAIKGGGRLRLKDPLPDLNVRRSYGSSTFATGRGSPGYLSSVAGA